MITALEIVLMIAVIFFFLAYCGACHRIEQKDQAIATALQSFTDINELADIKGEVGIRLVSEMTRRTVERMAKGVPHDKEA